MKDLLFGVSDLYNWNQIKPWAQSIRDSGFSGDVTLLVYRGDITNISNEASKYNIEVFCTNSDNWGKRIGHNSRGRDTQCHQMRFFHLWQYLDEWTINQYQNVITTDVRDVIFQKNPSEWLLHNLGPEQIIAPSEEIAYEHEPWGADNLKNGFGPYVYEHMKTSEIFNVGTIAGDAHAMKSLSLLLFSMGEGRYIPNDQSAFNVLVDGGLISIRRTPMKDGWACQCGTTMDPEKFEVFRPYLLEPKPKPTIGIDGWVYTSGGEKFVIVHQWDRVPSLKKIIEERYEI